MLAVEPRPASTAWTGADQTSRYSKHENEHEEHRAQIQYHEVRLKADLSELVVLLLIIGWLHRRIKDIIRRHHIESGNCDQAAHHHTRKIWEGHPEKREVYDDLKTVYHSPNLGHCT